MNFNEFVNEVKDNIRLFLPKDYENAEVSINDGVSETEPCLYGIDGEKRR